MTPHAHTAIHYDTADVNYRRRLYQNDRFRLDGLLGYRYAGLHDNTAVTNTFSTPGTRIVRKDTAYACNDFNGGQLGLAGTYAMGPWQFSGAGKVALGGTRSEIRYFGATTMLANFPDGVTLYSADEFAVLPSFSLMLSRQLWSHCRGYVGYEFQYLSRVARSDDTFHNDMPAYKSDFWAQGLTLGFDWRY